MQKQATGPSVSYNKLKTTYRQWSLYSSNYGGWPASSIRIVLNGYDWTSDSSHGNTIGAGGLYSITSSNCLLSWFPSELQSAIVAKDVKSDPSYSDTYYENATTQDKLWLFSGKEVYVNSGSNNGVIRNNEGNLYTRAMQKNITTSNVSGIVGYCVDGSSGSTQSWWLRSLSKSYANYVYYVYSLGGASYYSVNLTYPMVSLLASWLADETEKDS